MISTPWLHLARRAIQVASTLALCVPVLVLGRPDYETRAGRESTELAKAINEGDLQKVKELIVLRPACVNEWEAGLPPLHIAVMRTNAAIVELLLNAHANVDAIGSAREELLDKTALSLATGRYWNQDIVELLIAHGADINKRGNSGRRPIHVAALGGHATTLEYLIARGAKLEVRSDHGETPLIEAVHWLKIENVRILLAAGADPNAKNKNRETALHFAAFRDFPAAIELLIASHANVNARMAWGWTPLHVAMKAGHTNCAAILQSHGAKK